MLSGVEVKGRAAGAAAAERLRDRVAGVLRDMLPEVDVTVGPGTIYLSGTVGVDDPRLRWIGSALL